MNSDPSTYVGPMMVAACGTVERKPTVVDSTCDILQSVAPLVDRLNHLAYKLLGPVPEPDSSEDKDADDIESVVGKLSAFSDRAGRHIARGHDILSRLERVLL